MEKVERILVPIDFSDYSKEAFDAAVTLAGQTHATILLAHVLEPIGSPIDFARFEPPIYPELKIGQTLDRMARPGREKGLLIETHILKGDPPVEIVKATKDLSCDLIVMGTHGRTGMAHLLMGSVAERVIRSSAVPVLVVRLRKEVGEKRRMGAVGRSEEWGIII